MRILIILSLIFCLGLSLPASGQDDTAQTKVQTAIEKFKHRQEAYSALPAFSERLASSEAISVTLDGITLSYGAHVNRTHIDDVDDILPDADVVSFSYERIGDNSDITRPVLFAFNGGPGSTSVWLHMGAWGPQRIDTPGEPSAYRPPPYGLQPNQGFLIDVADLVFVDPVNTGLSALTEEGDATAFNGLRTDARAQCLFVRNWMKANDRIGAPIYLAGESYGTLRIAAMQAHPVCRQLGLRFDGLIFVSGLLDLRGRSISPQNTIMRFPTQAALSWYHGKIDKTEWNNSLDEYLDAARRFAVMRIGPAFLQSSYVDTDALSALREETAAFLGLELETSGSLVPSQSQYALPEKGHPALYDGRYMKLRTDKGHGMSPLPPISMDALGAAFTSGLRTHMFTVTGLDIGEAYTWRGDNMFNGNWDYRFINTGLFSSGTNMAERLPRQVRPTRKDTMTIIKLDTYALTSGRAHKDLRIMVASGLHDRATPFFGMQYPLEQARVKIDALHLYPGGHMMYLDEITGRQLAADVRSFITAGETSPATLP